MSCEAQTPKNSSPIVLQGRVWITGHRETTDWCFADAATGALLWRKAVAKFDRSPQPDKRSHHANPGLRWPPIFVFFPDVDSGVHLMARNVGACAGPFGGVQGMAASSIYAEGNVVLLIDTPEQAYLAAFNAETGKQCGRPTAPSVSSAPYTTPLLYARDGPARSLWPAPWNSPAIRPGPASGCGGRAASLMVPRPPLIAGDSIYTLEPTGVEPPPFSQMLKEFDKNKNGKIELTEISGDSVNDKIMYRLFKAADKISGNGDGVVTEEEWNRAFTFANGGLVRTRLNGKGDVTQTHVAWRYAKGLPYITGPLLYNDVLYVIRSGGILATFNPETGELLRQERLKDAIGDYYASPVAADGKIYFVNKEGKVTVIRAGANWKPLSSGDLDAQVIAAPAIAASRIYIRTDASLYCFGAKPPA
jgi:outer membrane protein assembly factor BamB